MGTICSYVGLILYCTGPPALDTQQQSYDQSRQTSCRNALMTCNNFSGTAREICIRDTQRQDCR